MVKATGKASQERDISLTTQPAIIIVVKPVKIVDARQPLGVLRRPASHGRVVSSARQPVQGAAYGETTPLQHVGIDLSGAQIIVPELFLYRTDVGAAL